MAPAVARQGTALFATGFNAWGQLSFGGRAAQGEPDDLFAFTKVLEAECIERPVARLSYTLVRRDGRLCMAGVGGEEAAYAVAEASNGEILAVQDGVAPVDSKEGAAQPPQVLAKYASMSALKARDAQKSWPSSRPVRTIAAFDAGFVILFEDGTVSTLGDARFEDCLGRDVDDESPADEPGIVADLACLGEPIKHVSAAGYNLAALTESGAIYVWGMSPSGARRRQMPFLPTVSRVPNYVDVDDDKDVQDLAVGDSHAIALTTDGSVYVIGQNSSGQLGLGRTAVQGTQAWTKVTLPMPVGHEVVSVAAGPWSSFLLTGPVQA